MGAEDKTIKRRWKKGMTVVKSKRKLSTMEFFHNALVLRKNVTELLMRDFGVKEFKRNIHFVSTVEGFSEEDKMLATEIFEKYEIMPVPLVPK